MTLKCQLPGIKCPCYKHQGVFCPDDATIKRLLPDLNRCADCIAYASPQRPDIREDLQQIASMVLLDKGPRFNPAHHSGATFGTFIRPRICGTLMDAKSRELTHSNRELPNLYAAWDSCEEPDAEVNSDVGGLLEVPDPSAAFEDELIRDISFECALPELLKMLTPRERDVFARIREHHLNWEIAEALEISEARVSQLITQMTQKLKSTGQRLGLAE